ncbi:MAG: DUF5671 domain-containing protein [Mycetocola sp.]
MSTLAVHPPQQSSSTAGQTVRRLIVYSLLFSLVVVTAVGLQTLLGLLFDPSPDAIGDTTSTIAQGLAFTLVGGPIGAVLWWFVWRRLSDVVERRAVAWGLYVAAASTVALIAFTTALFGTLGGLFDGDAEASGFATALVWAAIWVWHRWMWRHASRGPVRLASVPAVLGAAFGLVVGVSGAITAFGELFDAAIMGFMPGSTVGEPWWITSLQALVWAVGGAAVWAWHWFGERASATNTGLSAVVVIVLGIIGGTMLTLGGIGTAVYVTARVLFDPGDSVREVFSPLPVALAAAAVGAIVWVYHRGVAEVRSPAVTQASELATSGVALAAAASGIGVIVNSTLGILVEPLAGSDTRSLLLGGLSALIIGGPVWWLSWRPLTPTDAAGPSTGRRIYLIAVFGISAVVALITLLVIGFRLFEVFLDGGSDLVDQIRAPLGLLTATGLVAGYHFTVWRHDRAEAAAMAPAPRVRTIDDVVLVTAADPAPLVHAIEAASGASVTVWRSAHADEVTPDGSTPDPDALARALGGVSAGRVLVLVGPGDRLDVIPLAD